MGWLDEQAVMLAVDFLEGIAERFEEILVGRDDGAIQLKLDDRLRLVDGLDLASKII